MSTLERKSDALGELADQKPILSRLAVACHATCSGDHHVPDCSSAGSALAAFHTLSVRQAERVATLEAELARLKPSGQVAEDEKEIAWIFQVAKARDADARAKTVNLKFTVRTLRGWLERAQDAISRLSAKAQGYEAAMGNNVALVIALRRAKDAMYRGEFGDKGRDRDTPALVDAALSIANPGTALLEQHRKEVEALRAESTRRKDDGLVWMRRALDMEREVEAVLTTLPGVVRVREGAGPESLPATLAMSVAALQHDFRSTLDKAAAAGADAAAAWDEQNGGITPATARRGVAIAQAVRALAKTGPTS